MMISRLVTIRQQELSHCHLVVCRWAEAPHIVQAIASLLIVSPELTKLGEYALNLPLNDWLATGELI